MSFCDIGNRGHKTEIWAKKFFLTTRFIAKKCFSNKTCGLKKNFGPNFNFMPSILHITKTHKNDTMVKYLSNSVQRPQKACF